MISGFLHFLFQVGVFVRPSVMEMNQSSVESMTANLIFKSSELHCRSNSRVQGINVSIRIMYHKLRSCFDVVIDEH